MNEQFFDDLARGLDEGTISRRRAIKLFGAAALGAALMPVMPERAEALTRRARHRCRRQGGIPLEKGNCHCAATCTSDFSQFHCQSATDCTCVKKVSGGGFCAFGTTFNDPGQRCDNTEYICGSPRRCVVIPGCAGSGTACTSTDQCPAGFGCINGTCQKTACAPPCSCLRQGSPCDLNNPGACCSGGCNAASGCL